MFDTSSTCVLNPEGEIGPYYVKGELIRYGVREGALDIALNLYRPRQARAKRLLDVLSSVVLLGLAPLLVWWQAHKAGYLRNCLAVLLGRRSWVGLRYTPGPARARPAVLSPADAAQAALLNDTTRRRLELLYAKDYEPEQDLSIMLRNWRRLGQ